jgi:hypothetical protein
MTKHASKAAKPEIGTEMPDGTIYAGISPDTKKPMYTTPEDASLKMGFETAAEYAAKLDAHGHKKWRLPSKEELNVLFNNRAAIGGFPANNDYWSSTPSNYLGWCVWSKRFSDGSQDIRHMNAPSAVRCVR